MKEQTKHQYAADLFWGCSLFCLLSQLSGYGQDGLLSSKAWGVQSTYLTYLRIVNTTALFKLPVCNKTNARHHQIFTNVCSGSSPIHPGVTRHVHSWISTGAGSASVGCGTCTHQAVLEVSTNFWHHFQFPYSVVRGHQVI